VPEMDSREAEMDRLLRRSIVRSRSGVATGFDERLAREVKAAVRSH